MVEEFLKNAIIMGHWLIFVSIFCGYVVVENYRDLKEVLRQTKGFSRVKEIAGFLLYNSGMCSAILLLWMFFLVKI